MKNNQDKGYKIMKDVNEFGYGINTNAIEFLSTSNDIEMEDSREALEDAIKAWNYALALYNFSSDVDRGLNMILGIHRTLMTRLNSRIAGKVRSCSVTIGARLRPFISVGLIEQEIASWYRDYISAVTEDGIKKAHIAFEHIHPFEDGNGRVGRIIMNVQRVYAQLPLLIIHPGEEQGEYYKWF